MLPENTYRLANREPTWKGVYRNLRLAILNLEIAPDTRLNEVKLSEALGVSRTPLREALARLEMDGLIGAAKGGGYIVTDPRADLADAYHLRSALEGYGARLAAENITAAPVARLRANVDANRRIDLADTRGRAALNLEFHQTLIDASNSPRLIQTYNNLREWIMTDSDMTLHSDDSFREFVKEHDLIVSAMEMRDGDMADRIVRRHLRRAMDLLLEGKGRAAAAIKLELPAA